MNRDQIHEEILGNISDKFDKRIGSFIYLVTRPVAILIEKVYQNIEDAKEKLSIENLSGDELEQRIKERTGVTRRQATRAIGTLTAIGNGIINEGDLFETESGLQFEATETVTIVESGTVAIRALIAGSTGIVPANQINHIPVTLDNIDSVTNEAATFDGFDAETDESLLQRYFERIRTPATSGNKAHYLNWAKEVPGVGDARVQPLWAGNNTVKVIIIDADKQPASTELVEAVQDYIDPGITGLGMGEAPIGSFCTIVSSEGLSIDVSFTAIKDPAYTEQQVIANVKESITEYLKSIAFVEDYVSYAQVGATILRTAGILDYSDLRLNDQIDNITIEEHEVAILGGVTID